MRRRRSPTSIARSATVAIDGADRALAIQLLYEIVEDGIDTTRLPRGVAEALLSLALDGGPVRPVDRVPPQPQPSLTRSGARLVRRVAQSALSLQDFDAIEAALAAPPQ